MKLEKPVTEIPFTDETFGDYLYKTIIKDVNDIKSQVIDLVTQNEHKSLKKPQDFLNKVNDFLKFWYNYGKRAAEAIEANGVLPNPTENLKYSYVRKFLFNSYDFKSVLLYVDGMVKHIADGKKKYTQEDLESFYRFTIKDAFGTDDPDLSALLTDLEVSGETTIPDEEPDFDINMIQGYDIFKDHDYTDLYKSIEGIIDFISFDRMKNLFLLKKQIKNPLLTSVAVRTIFDYMIYSLAFFAIRIYVVAKFLNNFVNTDKTSELTEAVINSQDSLESFLRKMVIFKLDLERPNWFDDQVFTALDEVIVRDPDKTKFLQTFEVFARLFEIDNFSFTPMTKKEFISTFGKPFMESKLFRFFLENDFSNPEFNPNMTEFFLTTKYLFNTSKLAFVTSKNPVYNHKTKFFDILITLMCDEKFSIQDLKKSSILVYKFARFFFENFMKPAFDWVNRCHCREIKPSEFTTEKKYYTIINQFFSEFFDEFSYIIFKIMNYIENKIGIFNYDKKSEKDDISINTSPKYVRTAPNFDQIFIDTQEVFHENFLNIYSYPYYENIKIYESYLKQYPEFVNLSFFKEDGANNDWISKIEAWIKGIFEKIMKFFESAKVKNCINWVKNNESKIKEATFSDDTTISDCYLYKDKVEVDHIKSTISVIKQPDNGSLSGEGDKASEFSEDKYNDWEYDLYKNLFEKYKATDKTGLLNKDKTAFLTLLRNNADKVKNAIVQNVFFIDDIAEMPTVDKEKFVEELAAKQKTSVKGAEIKTKLDIAIGNVSVDAFNTATDLLKSSVEEINKNIKSIKEAMLKESVDMYLSEEGDAAQEVKKAGEKTDAAIDANQQSEEEKKKKEAATKLKRESTNKVELAFNRVLMNYVIPVQIHLPKFFLNQYNFIQAAYNARSNKSS